MNQKHKILTWQSTNVEIYSNKSFRWRGWMGSVYAEHQEDRSFSLCVFFSVYVFFHLLPTAPHSIPGYKLRQEWGLPTHSFTHIYTPHATLYIYPIPLSPLTILPSGLVFFFCNSFFPSAFLGFPTPLFSEGGGKVFRSCNEKGMEMTEKGRFFLRKRKNNKKGKNVWFVTDPC